MVLIEAGEAWKLQKGELGGSDFCPWRLPYDLFGRESFTPWRSSIDETFVLLSIRGR